MKINFNSKIFTKKYREYIADIYSIAIDTIKPACTDLEVNVAFVSKSEIHRLNHEFRGVDRATDVLSFPTLDYVGDHPSWVFNQNQLSGRYRYGNWQHYAR